MKWQVEFRPVVEQDVAEARHGLRWVRRTGAAFVEEIIRVWDTFSETPLLDSRRHPIQEINALSGARSLLRYLRSEGE